MTEVYLVMLRSHAAEPEIRLFTTSDLACTYAKNLAERIADKKGVDYSASPATDLLYLEFHERGGGLSSLTVRKEIIHGEHTERCPAQPLF